MEPINLPLYVPHPGTVKVSSSTMPRKAAFCAMAFMEERRPDVEFLFIGAAAGQQALKAVGILCDLFENKWQSEFVLVFRPMRFRTTILPTTPTELPRDVDAQVWRAVVLDLGILSNAGKSIR